MNRLAARTLKKTRPQPAVPSRPVRSSYREQFGRHHERALQPLQVAGAGAGKLLARAQQVAPLLRDDVGHEAGADRPWASRSASRVASFTSVLRPGRSLTCLALARMSSNSAALRIFPTGRQ